MSDREREFDAFVASSGRRLLRASQLLTGDHHRAEDLLQDVLARAYVRWDRISGSPEAYVRQGLLNGQRSWWRSPARRHVLGASFLDVAVPDDHAMAHAVSDSVLRAMATLTARERSVIVLRFWLDLTERATAAELGIAVGTVKSTTARALTRLRASGHLVRTAQHESTSTPCTSGRE